MSSALPCKGLDVNFWHWQHFCTSDLQNTDNFILNGYSIQIQMLKDSGSQFAWYNTWLKYIHGYASTNTHSMTTHVFQLWLQVDKVCCTSSRAAQEFFRTLEQTGLACGEGDRTCVLQRWDFTVLLIYLYPRYNEGTVSSNKRSHCNRSSIQSFFKAHNCSKPENNFVYALKSVHGADESCVRYGSIPGERMVSILWPNAGIGITPAFATESSWICSSATMCKTKRLFKAQASGTPSPLFSDRRQRIPQLGQVSQLV